MNTPEKKECENPKQYKGTIKPQGNYVAKSIPEWESTFDVKFGQVVPDWGSDYQVSPGSRKDVKDFIRTELSTQRREILQEIEKKLPEDCIPEIGQTNIRAYYIAGFNYYRQQVIDIIREMEHEKSL